MKIMGVDPSISCTGISLPDATTLAIKPRTKGDLRLREIADHIHVAAVGCGAELVVMEGLFGVYKGEAARIIPMLHGALRLELMRLPVPYMVLNPTTLKTFATGNPNAGKTDMQMAAYKRLGREYRTHDECDADWCRVAGRLAYGLGEYVPRWDADRPEGLRMPQVNLAALRRTKGPKPQDIVWPEVGGRKPWPVVGLRSVTFVDEEVPHGPGKAVLCGACARLGRSVCA